ncbi:MAG: hypothetical protein AAFU73_05130 [Planctomycetota bacterium]
MQRLATTLFLVCVLLATVHLLRPPRTAAPAERAGPERALPVAGAERPVALNGARIPRESGSSPVTCAEPPALRSFEAVFGEICAHLERNALGEAPRHEVERSLGPLYGELAGRHGLVDDYLRVSDALAAPWDSLHERVRTLAVGLGLDLALQVMRDHPEAFGTEMSADIAACIDRVLFHEEYCRLVTAPLLAGRFAGPEHAPQIVSMLGSLDAGHEWAREPLARLLTQIWSRSNDRSGLLTQAMGRDASLATAALASLLHSDEYRALALRVLVERGELELAERALAEAVRTLDAEQGLALTKQVREAFPYANLIGAYSTLAAQHRDALVEDYERARDDTGLARHRRDMTTALCFPFEADAPAFASAVFADDPDVLVRGTALLALASFQAEQQFRTTLADALGDGVLASADHRHFIAAAISNYATGERPNADLVRTALDQFAALGPMSDQAARTVRSVRGRY